MLANLPIADFKRKTNLVSIEKLTNSSFFFFFTILKRLFTTLQVQIIAYNIIKRAYNTDTGNTQHITLWIFLPQYINYNNDLWRNVRERVIYDNTGRQKIDRAGTITTGTTKTVVFFFFSRKRRRPLVN